MVYLPLVNTIWLLWHFLGTAKEGPSIDLTQPSLVVGFKQLSHFARLKLGFYSAELRLVSCFDE